MFLDALANAGLRRDGADASILAVERIRDTCASIGVTDDLKEAYQRVLAAKVPYRPYAGSAVMLLAELRELRKVAGGRRGASRCDESTREFRAWHEDGFLLHDAHATGATWIVTKDPRVPYGWYEVPLRRGGRLRVYVADPGDV